MIPWSESVEKLVTEFMAAYPKQVTPKTDYTLIKLNIQFLPLLKKLLSIQDFAV